MNYSFEAVLSNTQHIEILFSLLSKRKFNISHKNMPSYQCHKKFVISNPYRYWFLVVFEKEYIGSFYIKFDNSIGIKIDKEHYSNAIKKIIDKINFKFKPSPAQDSIVSENFFINVPFDDLDFNKNLTKIGYEPNQISYLIN